MLSRPLRVPGENETLLLYNRTSDGGVQRTEVSLGGTAAGELAPGVVDVCCSRPLSLRGVYLVFET